jgi:hypothetical protein
MSVEDVKIRFGLYKKPTERTIPKFETIRKKVLELALLIEGLCPESKQKDAAFNQLEMCRMSANAAIAINEGE